MTDCSTSAPLPVNATLVDAFGYFGGALLAVSLVPQLYRTWTIRSAHDLSYMWQGIHGLGLSLTLVYMIWEKALAGWICVAIEIGFLFVCFLQKFYFDVIVRYDKPKAFFSTLSCYGASDAPFSSPQPQHHHHNRNSMLITEKDVIEKGERELVEAKKVGEGPLREYISSILLLVSSVIKEERGRKGKGKELSGEEKEKEEEEKRGMFIKIFSDSVNDSYRFSNHLSKNEKLKKDDKDKRGEGGLGGEEEVSKNRRINREKEQRKLNGRAIGMLQVEEILVVLRLHHQSQQLVMDLMSQSKETNDLTSLRKKVDATLSATMKTQTLLSANWGFVE